ncbi:hypothetical protein TRFO_13223 [Tritrichomonas foetus]|uniref:Uncharacterized protein n=1 Tax=Tritrichomonas foetus TaxID=1144522 RepID=A0A1J4KZT2_9EUKA|nr:hypothetical protein TRFO_13223 [Tritrichomonas foetus]|eukprot:OHT16376.1 hypothetical protein TRFO_13223 [Tritrichomonas foetus]
MTQEIPPDSDEMLKESLSLISDIFRICQMNNELTPIAVQRLTDMAILCDNQTEAENIPSNKCRAQKDIEDHITMRKKLQLPIKPTSVVYRDIAGFLSKKLDLQFDPKATKKKKDLFHWFDQHWIQIKDQFFILLDQHPLTMVKKGE